MKRVFLEHLGLIVVAIMWAVLAVSCSTAPEPNADLSSRSCIEIYSAISTGVATPSEVVRKSLRTQGN